MTYSACDFADDIYHTIQELGFITAEQTADLGDDNLADASTLAENAIRKLAGDRAALLAALEALVNDFDQSVWTKEPMLVAARAAIAAARGEG